VDICQQFIAVNQNVSTYEEIIKRLVQKLYAVDYVTSQFLEHVLQRERLHPTGLETALYGVAIPHADEAHVMRSSIAVASLKEPVVFYQMGATEKKVKVKLVFLLAIKQSEDHLALMTKLMHIFNNKKLLQQLAQSKDELTMMDQLQHYLE